MSGKKLFVRSVPLIVLMCAVVTAAAAQTPKQTATEYYTSYRAAFQKAKAIEDLSPMMSKDMKAQVEQTPAAERPKMFAFIQEMSKGMTNVKVVKETKTADGATLTVEAMDGKEKMTGTVQIINEGGAWKMGKESWSNK
jgi:hypothetical protein